MLARIDAESNNGLLAKRLGSLQSVQTLDQHKARSIGPHQDWGLLALVEHARSNFVYALLFQSRAPFDRYVDIRDVKVSCFNMRESKSSMDGAVSARYLFLSIRSLSGGAGAVAVERPHGAVYGLLRDHHFFNAFEAR